MSPDPLTLAEEAERLAATLAALHPHLEIAAQMAAIKVPGSTVLLGVMAKRADGSGEVTCDFEAAGFIADIGKIAAVAGDLAAALRTQTTEHDGLADAAERLVQSLGEYVRQSMHATPEWRGGIEAIESALSKRPRPSARYVEEHLARVDAERERDDAVRAVAALRALGAP